MSNMIIIRGWSSRRDAVTMRHDHKYHKIIQKDYSPTGAQSCSRGNCKSLQNGKHPIRAAVILQGPQSGWKACQRVRLGKMEQHYEESHCWLVSEQEALWGGFTGCFLARFAPTDLAILAEQWEQINEMHLLSYSSFKFNCMPYMMQSRSFTLRLRLFSKCCLTSLNMYSQATQAYTTIHPWYRLKDLSAKCTLT